MAVLEVRPTINGQVLNFDAVYGYLNEPYPVSIYTLEAGVGHQVIQIDVYVTKNTGTIVDRSYLEYAIYDLAEGEAIDVDLMELARQIQNNNVYKFGILGDIVNFTTGFDSVTADRYNFGIKGVNGGAFTNLVSTIVYPIIGSRTFSQFEPTVDGSNLTEFERYNVPSTEYRFIGMPTMNLVLGLATATDPITYEWDFPTTGKVHDMDNGYLIWKSRFGGWLNWGFDSLVSNEYGSINGVLAKRHMENAYNPYIAANYTDVTTRTSAVMKSFNIPKNTLKALSGIVASPAVYLVHTINGSNTKIELVKASSISAPMDTTKDGGDFSVNVDNISESQMNAR